jgi:hypothetical protein
MRIFALDGKKGLKHPGTWRCIANLTAAAFTVKRKGTIARRRSSRRFETNKKNKIAQHIIIKPPALRSNKFLIFSKNSLQP